MEAIGIIFFACLAFAIAILILITCCFFKVNGGKDSRDLEMFKADRVRRMHQVNSHKSANEMFSKQNQNVILFLNKKNKYSNDPRNTDLNMNGHNHRLAIDDVDGAKGINDGHLNDAGGQHDGINQTESGRNDNNCNESNKHDQAGTGHHSLSGAGGNSMHGKGSGNQENHGSSLGFGGTNHQNHSTSHNDHGIGHFNEGFSSHFSSSHHGWGHHSGDSGHYGDNGCDGGGND